MPQEAQEIGISISDRQLQDFVSFAGELAEWNQNVNLSAIRDAEGIRRKLFLESLTCLQVMLGSPMDRVIDVGAGAGFPGFPLKIMRPEMHLTLVESVGKKTDFLAHIVQELGLQDVAVENERVEKLGQTAGHREVYDWAVARAVAAMPVLVEYLLPLVRVGGFMLAQKGKQAHEEVETAIKAIRILGGGEPRLERVSLPGQEEERYLVVVEKIAPTPEKYPRHVGVPSKNPL